MILIVLGGGIKFQGMAILRIKRSKNVYESVDKAISKLSSFEFRKGELVVLSYLNQYNIVDELLVIGISDGTGIGNYRILVESCYKENQLIVDDIVTETPTLGSYTSPVLYDDGTNYYHVTKDKTTNSLIKRVVIEYEQIFVTSSGKQYRLINNKLESTSGIYVGDTPPTNKELLWINKSGGINRPTDVSPEIAALKKAVADLTSRLQSIEYIFNKKMDSGDFSYYAGSEFKDVPGIEPGSEEDVTYPDATNTPKEEEEVGSLGVVEVEPVNDLQPNVKHICIKRGYFDELTKYPVQDGELLYAKDKNYLYIGNDGKLKLISGGGGGDIDPGNPEDPDKPDPSKPMEYIDLIVEGSTKTYRVKVDNEGNLIVYNSEIDDAKDQVAVGDKEQLKGLMIATIYAGPEGATAESYNVCSHSYVELYNASTQDINLKGCSLQYATTKSTWGVIVLKGIIPSGHSFLIRCNPVSDPNVNTTVVNVDRYDMDCPDVVLTNKGVKLYLCIGTQDIGVNNPYNDGSFTTGYIDLVGLKNKNSLDTLDINGYETSPASILTDERGATRNLFADFNSKNGDTNNNSKDFRPIQYNKDVDIKDTAKVYKPYCVADGPKDLFYCKTKLDGSKPNMPTTSIGLTPTTRTFNWVSLGYYDEFLMYKLKSASEWTTVESFKTGDYARRRIKGFDGERFTVHKVILENLSEGEYEWKCGKEDGWTDTFSMIVESPSQTDTFKFIHISDQQGWTYGEYEPWGISCKKIIETENSNINNKFPANENGVHFMINTGDMTQNGNRPSEWLDYYNAAGDTLPNFPQMNVVGNNDLCPNKGEMSGKINPDSFEYFYTYQYEKTTETANLQKYNGEYMKSVYSYDYGCAHFVVINSNNYIEEQKAWFKAHMAEVQAREVQPKWLIFVTHDAMFNITTDYTETAKVGSGKRDSKLNQAQDADVQKRFSWSRLLEEYNFNLVLSGHKHTYSRTWPLKETLQTPSDSNQNLPVNYLRPTYTKDVNGEGVTYVMSQATGYKLKSNKDVPVAGIEWLAKYFPGSGNTVNSDQKAPTYIVWTISPTQIDMKTYQVPNLTNGGSWSAWDGGQAGVTDLENNTPVLIDSMTLLHK